MISLRFCNFISLYYRVLSEINLIAFKFEVEKNVIFAVFLTYFVFLKHQDKQQINMGLKIKMLTEA